MATVAPRTIIKRKQNLRRGPLSRQERELAESWFPIKSVQEIARAFIVKSLLF